MPYYLRCSVDAHTKDVRSVGTLDNTIISGSRDNSLKLWKEAEVGYEESTTVNYHSHFVSAVCGVPSCKLFPEGLIFSGSHDKTIIGYLPFSKEPYVVLTGHTSPVCCVTPSIKEGHLLSSSWDFTAKMWDIKSGKCVTTYTGHTQAVWAVLHTPENLIITGSADRFINVYSEDGTFVRTLRMHTDCVRGLAVAGPDMVLSCGNDGSVMRWNVQTGTVIEILATYPSFIYTVAAQGSVIALGGEETNVLVIYTRPRYKEEVIRIPAKSVWSVAFLPNSDIVVGTNDGRIRVFTQDTSRMASREILDAYEEELDNDGAEPAEFSNLPGREALQVDGTSDGEVKLIRSGGKSLCYSWSQATRRWNLLGEASTKAAKSQLENDTVPKPYYPPENYVLFEQYDINQILKKLEQFMGQIEFSEVIIENVLRTLKALVTATSTDGVDLGLNVLFEAAETWPETYVFPILDICRIVILNQVVHPIMFNEKYILLFLNSTKRFMDPKALVNNKMFFFRIVSNMTSGNTGQERLYPLTQRILSSIPTVLTESHKGLEIAISTFLLNVALSAYRRNDPPTVQSGFDCVLQILPIIKDPEATFRMLVAIGTMGLVDDIVIVNGDILQYIETVSGFRDPEFAKAAHCANSLLKDMSNRVT